MFWLDDAKFGKMMPGPGGSLVAGDVTSLEQTQVELPWTVFALEDLQPPCGGVTFSPLMR
jgi:hypothetical protein